mmetsp:Transcript_61261/g.147455  ORF Transcript_61261/g.147455 Transcript_61261/m.147455 type:complete len:226 (-) Transcript_61261:366-1043(-)
MLIPRHPPMDSNRLLHRFIRLLILALRQEQRSHAVGDNLHLLTLWTACTAIDPTRLLVHRKRILELPLKSSREFFSGWIRRTIPSPSSNTTSAFSSIPTSLYEPPRLQSDVAKLWLSAPELRRSMSTIFSFIASCSSTLPFSPKTTAMFASTTNTSLWSSPYRPAKISRASSYFAIARSSSPFFHRALPNALSATATSACTSPCTRRRTRSTRLHIFNASSCRPC